MKYIVVLFALIISSSLSAQDSPLWLRYPSIPPDGQKIVLTHKGVY